MNTAPKSDQRFTLPDEDATRHLKALIEITKIFREVAPTLPVSYMHAFLEVCLKPGGGSTDYMARLDTIQPIMSRILLHLGSKARRQALGEGGYKLIDSSSDPMDLRRDRYFLTPKGRTLLAKIYRELRKIDRQA